MWEATGRETCAIPSPGVRGVLTSAVISDMGYLPPLLHSGATSQCRSTAGPQRCTRHMHASPSALAPQQEGSKVMTAAPLVRGWLGVCGIQFPEAVYWKKMEPKWATSHERLVFLVRQCVRLCSPQLTISCGFYIFVYFFIFNYAWRLQTIFRLVWGIQGLPCHCFCHRFRLALTVSKAKSTMGHGGLRLHRVINYNDNDTAEHWMQSALTMLGNRAKQARYDVAWQWSH